MVDGPLDHDAATFWDAVRGGRLIVQRCDDCGTYRFPPRPVCWSCGGAAASWTDVAGSGRVISWTTTHHRFHPDVADRVPYTVVLVELDEQPDLVMYGSSTTPELLALDAPVRAAFVPGIHTDTVVEWQVTSESAPPIARTT